jgi:hypothetical protein
VSKPYLYLGNLNGEEGNAFVILGRAQDKVREVGEKAVGETWKTIRTDAMSKDYAHLLSVVRKYFDAHVLSVNDNGHSEIVEL